MTGHEPDDRHEKILPNTQFRVFTEGDELYADLLEAIGQARESIRLECYIFGDDEVGREFVQALTGAALRGVRVRVSLDAAGSLGFAMSAGPERLIDAGVGLKWFNPPRFVSLARLNRRDHRKLVVVDDQYAWLGGFNIHSECSRQYYGEERWRDTQVRLTGNLARQAGEFFDYLWWNQRRRHFEEVVDPESQLVSNHNWRQRHRFRRQLMQAIGNARSRVWLTTPYFMPDHRTQVAMSRAAQDGVDVRLLVPYKTDRPVTQWAARAAYAFLLKCGVRIFEYQPRLLHAKTAVIDDNWCTVGTANLDYRSFYVNYEMNLVSTSSSLLESLAEDFSNDQESAKEITEVDWSHRGLAMRLAELIGWMARKYL